MKNGVKRIQEGFVVPNPVESGKRWNWLINLVHTNDLTIGAEIGAARGRTTQQLLKNCLNLKLIVVDLWGTVPESVGGGRMYHTWDFPRTKKIFENRTNSFKHRMNILKGISWEMADKVDNNSLDFIFIDADHEYQSVINDIRAWTPKLKDGGFITGHDTHFPEVEKAINELTPNWKSAGVDHVWWAKKEDVKL